MDTDSILYIVITVVILIISTLGNRRKKQAAQAQAQQMKAKRKAAEEERDSGTDIRDSGQPASTAAEEYYARQEERARESGDRFEPVAEEEPEEEYRFPGSRLFGDQFKDLARAFAPQPQSSQGSPLDRLEQFITGRGPETQPQPEEYREGISMEDTVDEEEQILEEIRKRRESDDTVSSYDEDGSMQIVKTERSDRADLPPLFEDVDEIKKAIIYSEILHRKYT